MLIDTEKYKMDNWSIKNIKVKKEEDILFSLVKEGLIRFKLKRVGFRAGGRQEPDWDNF